MYDAVTDGLITHDGSPQMIRHFASAVLREDARGARITKDRRGSVNKIDIAVASLIAYHRAVGWRAEDVAESQLLVL
jgi:phage terminase large subunit-like protein